MLVNIKLSKLKLYEKLRYEIEWENPWEIVSINRILDN